MTRQANPNSFSSECTTRGIRVQVDPVFDALRSNPGQGQWLFLYTVTISNESSVVVQLLNRHWIITDGLGQIEEVRGPGVVGAQPILSPGESYQYTSGCPLSTDVGSMQGTYEMATQEGELFEVEIAPFTLCADDLIH